MLHEALAIVERPGHFKRGDVFAERRELFFLGFADALRRIENHDANSGHTQETVRYSATRVPGSCHKDGEWTCLAAHEITHQARHKARAKILECQRRPMKEFQDVESRGE